MGNISTRRCPVPARAHEPGIPGEAGLPGAAGHKGKFHAVAAPSTARCLSIRSVRFRAPTTPPLASNFTLSWQEIGAE